jgi:hypothetical protein
MLVRNDVFSSKWFAKELSENKAPFICKLSEVGGCCLYFGA